MKEICLDLNKGEIYNGFEVLEINDISDYKAKGIWLKHKASDLEVFHIVCDDKENLFAFAFGTPSENSTGVAHILEHSVLCGSEAYPLKNPFIRLANQSIKTFLNAMTFPDKTVYPASSVSREDYFNLMAVYGDAVFFPKLEKWTFLQEGHRLELDANNEPSIQGVVYNEMKGNYSSFDGVASDWVIKTMLKDTIYDYDSGGDPLDIPNLTYEEYLNFHHVHYSPSNCKVFLYGDISTKEQLDFLNSKILSRFKDFYFKDNSKKIKDKLTQMKFPTRNFENGPLIVEKPGPMEKNKTDSSTVNISWCLEDAIDPISRMEIILLIEILMGHDGSPLSRALVESNLGEDLVPNCGLFSEMKWSLLNTGLRGVPRENSQKVYQLVKNVIQNLYENGIPQENLDAAILSVEFSQREIQRFYGPYSLVLMRRCLQGWLYGFPPFYTMSYISAFKTVKERVLANSDYLRNLLKTHLIDNNYCGIITVYPEESYETERLEREKKLAKSLLAQTTIGDVKKSQQALTEFQQTEDSPEVVKTLPHVSPYSLDITLDNFTTNPCTTKNNVPLFINEENTNGITYLKLCIPVDVLDPEDYLYLPLFSIVATNCGFGGKNWVDTDSRIVLNTGDFTASVFYSVMYEAQGVKRDLSVQGRDWLMYRCKFLVENAPEVMNIFYDCILTTDFSDKKRITDLIVEFKNDLISSVVPMGMEYASSRANCRLSVSCAKDEISHGLTQLFFILEQTDNIDVLIQRFLKIQKRLLEAGGIFHVISDSEGIEKIKPHLDSLVERTKISAPVEVKTFKDEDFYSLTDKPLGALNFNSLQEIQVFSTSTQVAFAALSCHSSSYATIESVAESVLAHLLTNFHLWEQIRTIGGAYGASAVVDPLSNYFSFSSYRDPKPYRSLQVYMQALEAVAKDGVDSESLEKAITGCYSKEIQPKTPSARGSLGFNRYLCGISPELRKKKLQLLLTVTPQDVSKAAMRILDQMKNKSYKSIVCGKNIDKSKENTGNIISLPV
ncbi:MAG: insulinase family protein [Spirochaetaceae bacterium]|nr:insulinase family protein [Spirochaetaceae bacterium]